MASLNNLGGLSDHRLGSGRPLGAPIEAPGPPPQEHDLDHLEQTRDRDDHDAPGSRDGSEDHEQDGEEEDHLLIV